MRLFAAVDLEPHALEALERSVAALRGHPAAPPGLRWLAPASWHLTLQFFGEVDEQGALSLRRACDAAVHERSAFELVLSDLGAFPRPERARVVWLGVASGARELEALARALWQRSEALGFVPEARAFRPHLTLARCRKPARVRELLDAGALGETQSRVTGLGLYRSHLSREGARYERLHFAPLAG